MARKRKNKKQTNPDAEAWGALRGFGTGIVPVAGQVSAYRGGSRIARELGAGSGGQTVAGVASAGSIFTGVGAPITLGTSTYRGITKAQDRALKSKSKSYSAGKTYAAAEGGYQKNKVSKKKRVLGTRNENLAAAGVGVGVAIAADKLGKTGKQKAAIAAGGAAGIGVGQGVKSAVKQRRNKTGFTTYTKRAGNKKIQVRRRATSERKN